MGEAKCKRGKENVILTLILAVVKGASFILFCYFCCLNHSAMCAILNGVQLILASQILTDKA